MEENSQAILLNSLNNAGVPIPYGVSAIQHLTPETLFPICTNSLSIIDRTLSFPSSLPEDSVADRFKICSDLATAFKRLGFIGDISFHKFLYPSEEDLYKLVRFLVGRLAEFSEPNKTSNENGVDEKVILQFKEGKPQEQASEGANVKSGNPLFGEFQKFDSDQGEMESRNDRLIRNSTRDSSETENRSITVGTGPNYANKVEVATNVLEQHGPRFATLGSFHNFERKQISLEENSCEEELSSTELALKKLELQRLEEEYEMLKAVEEMALDHEHPIEFYIQQLSSGVERRKDALAKLESDWSDLTVSLEEKKRNLEEALCTRSPVAQEKLQKRIDMEQEIEYLLAETKRREEELLALRADLQKQPKVESRQSFVERIKEITKNSRKQDADIERIIKETRELQLESNSTQERLHRTYTVVNETIFREARKDSVGREAYRILARIHQAFEQTAEAILVRDRTRREVADYEAKYAAVASRSIDIDKVRADLDAIRRENAILEEQLGSNQRECLF